MHILSHLKIRTKLTLLLGMSALALVASIGAAASLIHQRMFDDRVDKLRAVVQSTIAIAQSLEERILAHDLTREQALALLRDDIHAMRFDVGTGYVFAQTLDNIFVLHGAAPVTRGLYRWIRHPNRARRDRRRDLPCSARADQTPVSYTHLTLPTIYSV